MNSLPEPLTITSSFRPSSPTFKQRPLIRRVFDVEGTLANHRPGRPIQAVAAQTRHIFINWLKEKNVYITPDGFEGKSFVSHAYHGYKPAEGIGLENQWAVQIIDDDATVPGKKWMTEFYLDYRVSPVRFCVRQTVILPPSASHESPELLVPKLPRFVHQIANEIGLFDGEHGFLPEPWEVEVKSNFEEFYRVLLDPNRTRPILALTFNKQTQATLLNANWLAQHMMGIAHIVILDPQSCWELDNRLGKDFTVYDGAIRTYNPGFSPVDDEPYQHPLILSRRIQNWEGGARELEAFLATRLTKACSFALAKSGRLYTFSDFREQQIASQRIEAEAASPADLEALNSARIESLEKQIITLTEERDIYEQSAMEAGSELQQHIQQTEAIRAENLSLLQSLRELKADYDLLNQIAHQPAEAYPTSLNRLQAWAGKHWQGKLYFPSRAFRGAKNSHYEDVELVYKALDLLANDYRNMRLSSGREAVETYLEKLHALGLEDEPTFQTESMANAFDNEYYITDPQGRRSLLSQHLKKGTSKDQRYCLRIYYFWCNETEQVVIGWLPSHLKNRLT